ncbi:redoxin domain-containing protein [Bradyrhizobium nanningense]|uniref:redoxin domain-containing protein n=1 Tax=Bradyrhizobium nanningense TaxID=1325118 RepID=UPI001FDEBCBE|nr:redoxin domain-containing protein [Bradyrhizobium nanningense]
MNTSKLLVAAILAIAVAAPIAGFVSEIKGQPMMSAESRSLFAQEFPGGRFSGQRELASLGHASEWLNSPALTPESLRGKVVLINFWTYTCINWRRQLPYVRAWQEKYKDQGLVVIGVHAPEFEFEKDSANVRWAAEDMKIRYPIAVDAFNNQAWPALYFIDAQGRVRHQFFGEGDYERSENVIQGLLREAGAANVSSEPAVVEPRAQEATADWPNLRSPENYLGFARTESFASPGGLLQNRPHMYEAPTHLNLNEWALIGDWTARKDATELNEPGGSINDRFHARDLHLVMGPAAHGSPVKFRVLIDGHAPGSAHGVDIDAQAYGTLTEQRMYTLLRQPGQIVDRRFEIEFFDAGAQVYSFTFG